MSTYGVFVKGGNLLRRAAHGMRLLENPAGLSGQPGAGKSALLESSMIGRPEGAVYRYANLLPEFPVC